MHATLAAGSEPAEHGRRAALAPLAVAALGVVFGDIGTSPLYTLKVCLGLAGSRGGLADALGICSLLFWALVIVVCIKYVTFIMRVDHDGEGGILALLALASPASASGKIIRSAGLMLVVVVGASMLFGDGVITPAISVISAVEGISVVSGAFQAYIVPISLAVLIALFAVQRGGTENVGRMFGPVMILWFAAAGVLGALAIVRHPEILRALDPLYAARFAARNGLAGFTILGGVVLAVTGVEALYADLSHFGRKPIVIAWYAFVFPALILNYFGQGAQLLADPKAIENPFYALSPGWMLVPMVVLATAATVIASQALISGTFTLIEQAIALNLAPRVLVQHTSHRYKGQVYVPSMNVCLAIGCAALVVAFRSSDRLASAYGLAVAFTMLCTSIAYYVVISRALHWNRALSIALVTAFVFVDGSLVVASLPKFIEGGWIPISISALLLTISLTWLEGRRCLARALAEQQIAIEDVLEKLPAGYGAEGTMVFLTPDPRGVPFLARHRWIRERAQEERIVVLNIARAPKPHLTNEERVTVERFSLRLVRVIARFGYMEAPRIEPVLRSCEAFGLNLDRDDTSFFYADPKIEAAAGGMPDWRRRALRDAPAQRAAAARRSAHPGRAPRRARRHRRDLSGFRAERVAMAGMQGTRLTPLALAALGVVFGDIGTSPLYAFKQCFTTGRGFSVVPEHVLGILSLITWALIVVVCVKYATIVLRADNEGEGGTLALLAQLRPTSRIGIPAPMTAVTYLLLFAAGMVFGDGVITPAISVLSAVEGLGVATTAAQPFIVPITVGILIALFAVQSRGAGRIGAVFGPVMIVWLLAMAAGGAVALVRDPHVLLALSPTYALGFIAHNGVAAILVLGAVVLCVTGVEAMFADLAHFGRSAIRLAWYAVVFPSLLLNYYGQGALTLANPDALENPFYSLYPGWVLLPMVALATAATVIASQALISGAFSLTQQAVQLGYLPRLRIVHTSHDVEGQIYMPFVNALLAIACLTLVLVFRSADRLGAAYGLAVTVTMLADSLVIGWVLRARFRWKVVPTVALVAVFLVVDLAFLVGNLPKFTEGGYIPVAIAIVVYTLFTTWVAGRRRLAKALVALSTPVADFVRQIEATPGPATGTAVFLTPHPEGIPFLLRHHWLRSRMLREHVLLLTIANTRRPYVDPADRVKIETVAARVTRVTAYYGFMERPDVGDILRACRPGIPQDVDLEDADYLLARPRIVRSDVRARRFWTWRRWLLLLMMRNANPLTDSLGIAPDRIIEFGVAVPV